jgi:hypothetical protein
MKINIFILFYNIIFLINIILLTTINKLYNKIIIIYIWMYYIMKII